MLSDRSLTAEVDTFVGVKDYKSVHSGLLTAEIQHLEATIDDVFH